MLRLGRIRVLGFRPLGTGLVLVGILGLNKPGLGLGEVWAITIRFRCWVRGVLGLAMGLRCLGFG